MATQIAGLVEVNEALATKVARLEHVLSRNSSNSSCPASKNDGPGRTPPPEKVKRGDGGPKRKRGKQPGTAERICPGLRPPMSALTSCPRANASVVMTWLTRRTWE
jgi:hypothetical protein